MLTLIFATVFHGLYDYFLFITFVPGIDVVLSLIVAIILSSKAIRIHQAASPFINLPSVRSDLIDSYKNN